MDNDWKIIKSFGLTGIKGSSEVKLFDVWNSKQQMEYKVLGHRGEVIDQDKLVCDCSPGSTPDLLGKVV